MLPDHQSPLPPRLARRMEPGSARDWCGRIAAAEGEMDPVKFEAKLFVVSKRAEDRPVVNKDVHLLLIEPSETPTAVDAAIVATWRLS